jgi:hypothetical protein
MPSLVSRRFKQLVLVAVIVGVGFAARSRGSEIPPLPPPPSAGVSCFRAGGDQHYCQCLDRLESARGRPAPGLPPLDHPVIRYAMGHPHDYPILNSDTVRCVAPRVPPTPGVPA